MAFAAERRYMSRVGRRLRVFLSKHAMRTVTFDAGWGVGITQSQLFAVNASPIMLSGFGMTARAVNTLLDCVAGTLVRLIYSGMALAAGNRLMP